MKIKNYILVILSWFISISVFAQPANDNCTTAQAIGTLPAPAPCAGAGTQFGAVVNVPGTLVAATPASPYVYQNSCTGTSTTMAVPANDVWYTFTASSYQAVITINSTFANPNVAMYSGTCGALGGGVGGCAVGTGGTVTLTVEQMVIGTTYYIQVSGATGETGTFTMSIQNNHDCSDCLNASTLTVTPLPTAGTYAPGTAVTFCYHVDQYTQINTNWLHGVQITFGAGWNLASVVPVPPPACAAAGNWIYYPGGIIDAGGTAWPTGFYFDSFLGGPLDGNAGNNFGDNCSGVIAAAQWNFCFTVTTNAACTPGSDLSITINTSGDGESGSWTNLGCVDDPATDFHAVGSCCPPTMASTPSCPAGATGTATATPIGGAGPYDYTWTNAGGTVVSTTINVVGANTATGLAPGVYTVTVVDNNGCFATNTVTVGTIVLPALAAGNNGPLCAGATLNLTSTFIAGATYSWSGPSAFASALQNPSLGGTTVANAGVYTVTATVTGCPITATTTVVINPIPTINVNSPTYCAGGSAVLTATGGTTYTWAPPGGLSATTGASVTTTSATSTTYTVTGTTSGCSNTATSSVTVNPLPVINVPAATICNGASTVLTASGASTYTWAPATGLSATTGTSVTANPTVTTVYTVTGTDAVGCVGTTTVTVTVNPLPVVNVPPATYCFGGSAVLTASGASTYAWSPGGGLSATTGTSVTANPAATTIYTVTGTSAAGCVGTTTVTVTVNPLPTINVPAASICNGASTVLTASGASTYTWSPATGLSATTGTSVTANPVVTTVYTITGTDINGCVNSTTCTVTVTAAFDPTVSPAGPFCQNDPAVIMTAVDPGGTWSATCGACINAASGSFDPSLASVGANTVTYTIPGACGGVDTEVVTINANSNATINPVGPFCSTSPAIILTAVDPGGTWSATCGACVNAASGSFDPSLATVGSNTITYTIAGACGDVQTTIIDVQEVILVSAPVTDALCFGNIDGTITINATGATQYSDDNGGTFQASNLFTEGAGSYDLVVQNALGCQDNLTVIINEPPIVTAIPGGQDELCAGACDGFAVVAPGGGVGGYTFLWTGPATGTNALLSSLCPGTYNITVTDGNGCTASATQIINAAVPVIITSTPVVNVLCNGGANGSITVNATGTGVLQYSINGGALQASNVFNLLTAGAYTILVQDPAGCTATTIVNISEPTAVTVVAGVDQTICIGGSANITATGAGGTGPYTYTWTNSFDATVLVGQNQTVFPSANTTYTCTVTDANGCGPVADQTIITINPPLAVVAATTQSICPGTSVNISAVGAGGNGVYTYTWTNNINASVLTGASQTVSPTVTTTYTVTLTDNCGTPAATDVVTITIYPLPAVTYGPYASQGCSPLVVNFVNTTNAGATATCFWDFGDGTTSTNCNPTHVFTAAGCYDISLNIITSDGCLVDTIVYGNTCVFPIPVADFTFGPQPTDIFNTEIQFTNLTIGGSTYSWDFAGLGTSTAVNPTFIFPEDNGGNYKVCLSTVSNMGCPDSTCHYVIIDDVFLIYVPNTFTPEGDGVNDIFLPVIQGEDPLSYELMIFNRWGELIFESNNKLIGWDGTHKSIKSKEDVYVWKIKVKKKQNEDKLEYIGHVNLLR